MKGAWSQPLIQDDQACAWLQHASPQVVASAAHTVPLQTQTDLAEQLAEAGELVQAVRVLFNIIKMRELSLAEVQASATCLFEYCDRIHVKDRSSKCDKYEAEAAFKVVLQNTYGTAHWEIAFDRLMQLAERGADLDHSTTARIFNIKAPFFKGLFPTFTTPSALQFYDGGQLIRKMATQVRVYVAWLSFS
jgi:hypothetical protein